MTRVYIDDVRYIDECDACQGGRINDASPCACGGTGYRTYEDWSEEEDEEGEK